MAAQDGVLLGFTAEGHLDEDAMRQMAGVLDRHGLPGLVQHNRSWAEHMLFCDECEERLEAVREELEWEELHAPVLPAPLPMPDADPTAEPGLLERIWESATAVVQPSRFSPSVAAGSRETPRSRATSAGPSRTAGPAATPEVQWQDDAYRVVANKRLFGGTELRAQRAEDPRAPLAGCTIELQVGGRQIGPVTTDAAGVAAIEDLEFDADALAQARLRLAGPRPKP